ncbi:MAG: hypothetical protein ACR2HN_03940 [Tepidiformaceae bacterium]
MIAAGSAAPHVTLQSLEGEEVALARCWEERAAVLVFLRHFG